MRPHRHLPARGRHAPPSSRPCHQPPGGRHRPRRSGSWATQTGILNLSADPVPQNYTCANNTSSATPAPIGALAELYNASCIAANYPDILAFLPTLALQLPFSIGTNQTLAPANIALSGNHFFLTTTTPVFSLMASPDPARDLGVAVAQKVASSPAPPDATPGQGGVGYGAVAWLFLNTTDATVGNIRGVYRLGTAGGSPPPTCENMPPTFSVQYAAQYWFYGLP